MENEYSIDQIRHSAAHILATAATRLFPGVKIGIGPVTRDGYYYDFEFPRPVTWEEVKKIEAEMTFIIQQNLPFTRLLVPKSQAHEILLTRGQIYKAELLSKVLDDPVSFFKIGEEFIDLCRGPHVVSSHDIGAIKLTSLTSTHWNNDPERPAMQRITGVAFADLENMREYLAKEKSMKSRNFQQIAQRMELALGAGREVAYTPKGTQVLKTLSNSILSHWDQFEEISLIPSRSLQDLEEKVDDVFNRKNRSYRELPLRLLTSGRQEFSIPISISEKETNSINIVGLKSYLLPNQMQEELRLYLGKVIAAFQGLDLRFKAVVQLPNRDVDTTNMISEILQVNDVSHTLVIDATRKHGEILISFTAQDSFDREWDLLQLGYSNSAPAYVTKAGDFADSCSITVFWILERFLAYFLEDQDGGLPFWLSPIQIVIIPITSDQIQYSTHIQRVLKANGYDSEVDGRSETMQSRIRGAELRKVPIILVIGQKEQKSQSVSLRIANKSEVGLVSEATLPSTLAEMRFPPPNGGRPKASEAFVPKQQLS